MTEEGGRGQGGVSHRNVCLTMARRWLVDAQGTTWFWNMTKSRHGCCLSNWSVYNRLRLSSDCQQSAFITHLAICDDTISDDRDVSSYRLAYPWLDSSEWGIQKGIYWMERYRTYWYIILSSSSPGWDVMSSFSSLNLCLVNERKWKEKESTDLLYK